jgi:hypothetical protein
MLSVTRVDRALQTAHMGQAMQVSDAAREESSQNEINPERGDSICI